jgi:steroid delta-isomerase-like uncharacterized protein
MPTAGANIEPVDRFYAAIDAGDLAALATPCTADYRLHVPGVPMALDRSATKGFFSGFAAAIADLRQTIEDRIASDDAVAIRLTIRGTHCGDLNGIPATGREVTISALNLFHLAGGKIAEQWVEYDGLGLHRQLGATPAAPAT